MYNKRVEKISAFRNEINKFNNYDFDKMLAALDKPVVKKMIYNSKINFTKIAGSILKSVMKSIF